MHKESISGLLLTHGNRDIAPTLSSLAPLCGQIVLVNDSSKPNQLIGVDEYPGEVEVVEHRFDSFPSQRNFGMDNVSNEWTLVVDSDEIVSETLVENIQEVDPTTPTEVFMIPMLEVLRGRSLKYANFDSPHPRLFRSHNRYKKQPEIHEELFGLEVFKTEDLIGSIIHYHQENILELIVEAFEYGRKVSSYRQTEEICMTWSQIMRSIPGDLIKRSYLKDGAEGLAAALSRAAFHIGTKSK